MNHLVERLLEKNAINSDTVLTVLFKTGPSKREDNFMMLGVEKIGDSYRFRLKQLVGGCVISVWAREIIALDGMDPIRYVDVYDINPDGSNKKIGKKRGRKPKISQPIAHIF